MDREAISRYDMELVEKIEAICFKGKTHMKRGSGLTLVPEKLLIYQDKSALDPSSCYIKSNSKMNIACDIQTVFRNHFRGITNHSETVGPLTV